MKYKSYSIGSHPLDAGVSYKGVKKIVQPNQSMSLEEILERFTRGEALPIGQQSAYDETDDIGVDLEKIAKADLVDKEEFHDSLELTKRKYAQQEKNKKAEAEKKAKADYDKKIADEVEAKIKGSQPDPAK